ncbi:hypothetical protein EVAR_100331_1 [Eumeta japonica]|uniref:Uncharacterized protein n=1 Tax=Eumeta variegata TaxID=151549 RepID=A0A4C2AA69_EUMVA|nr:hypothetical protein EVAR_100331_1 [Eumeta japonica]
MSKLTSSEWPVWQMEIPTARDCPMGSAFVDVVLTCVGSPPVNALLHFHYRPRLFMAIVTDSVIGSATDSLLFKANSLIGRKLRTHCPFFRG